MNQPRILRVTEANQNGQKLPFTDLFKYETDYSLFMKGFICVRVTETP